MVLARLQWREECLEYRLPPLERYRIGRQPEGSDLVIPPHWRPCSRQQAELFRRADGWWLQDGSQGQPSANGTFLGDGTPVLEPRFLGSPGELTLLFGSHPQDQVKLRLNELPAAEPASASAAREITIGRHPGCTLVLDDPTVSRLHALVHPQPDGTALVQDRSSNGLFIDGRRAGRITRLAPAASLRIGRRCFRWNGVSLVPLGDPERYGIEVRDLALPKRLQPLSLSIDGGQLVALVGGSGAGKSSLLTTLAGQNPAYSGQIQVNGEDLRTSISALRPLMGYVPQDDIVHADLSVQEVLGFAARLRIPDREAQGPAVERVLDLLEIGHRRQALVRELSGGQRKRVNIGMELVSDPRLLFLDEPTSGLDPGLDRRMMRLLRDIADRGHTVLLVTHATAHVNLCDQLVFLGRGGRLCYAGTPSGCLTHFGVTSDFAEVYEQLEGQEHELEHIARQFRQHHPLPPLSSQQCGASASHPLGRGSLRPLRRFASQLRTLQKRELLLCRRDRLSLALNLLTAPVAVLLLAAAIHRREVFQVPAAGLTPEALPLAIKVVFVISCACIWSGISSHIGAVARERPIYERERSFNLMPVAYVAAKAWLIVLLAVPQALLIALTAALLFHLPGSLGLGPAVVGYSIAAFFTILATGSLALFLSTLVKDQRQAGSSSPLLLMPQLILSGVLFEIGSLTTLYPLVASRWSVKLFGAYSGLENLHQDPPLPSLPTIDVSPYLANATNVRDSVVMLALQTVGFTVLALLAIRRQRGLRG
jgi:ABC-type multidrug transport system ATPase subunit/pSer/pThr/pTyr-binding forkhead associated (FHA) protein